MHVHSPIFQGLLIEKKIRQLTLICSLGARKVKNPLVKKYELFYIFLNGPSPSPLHYALKKEIYKISIKLLSLKRW